MSSFLNWYTEHNAAIIQGLVVFIGAVFLFFIYRVFFVPQPHEEVHAHYTEKITPAAPEKVNELIEKMTEEPPPPTVQTEVQAISAKEFDDLQNHMKHLNEMLKDRETEIEKLQDEIVDLKNTGTKLAESNSSDAAAVAAEQANLNDELRKKIEELEAKLSEYEIIADDIADLPQLKIENQKLKEQLSQAEGKE